MSSPKGQPTNQLAATSYMLGLVTGSAMLAQRHIVNLNPSQARLTIIEAAKDIRCALGCLDEHLAQQPTSTGQEVQS